MRVVATITCSQPGRHSSLSLSGMPQEVTRRSPSLVNNSSNYALWLPYEQHSMVARVIIGGLYESRHPDNYCARPLGRLTHCVHRWSCGRRKAITAKDHLR